MGFQCWMLMNPEWWLAMYRRLFAASNKVSVWARASFFCELSVSTNAIGWFYKTNESPFQKTVSYEWLRKYVCVPGGEGNNFDNTNEWAECWNHDEIKARSNFSIATNSIVDVENVIDKTESVTWHGTTIQLTLVHNLMRMRHSHSSRQRTINCEKVLGGISISDYRFLANCFAINSFGLFASLDFVWN